MKPIYLNLLIVAALVVLAVGGMTVFDTMRPPPANVESAPDFTITDINGKTRSLQDFRDKTVILNFWATWCAPCIEEFPRLLKIAAQHKDNAVLLAVSSDVNEKLVHSFVKQMRVPMDANIIVARDTQDITGKLFHTYQIPETFIIDRDGAIRAKFSGDKWQPQELERYIE